MHASSCECLYELILTCTGTGNMRQTCSIWKKNNMAPQPNFNCAIKLMAKDESNKWKPKLCTDAMVKQAKDKTKDPHYECSKTGDEILLREVWAAI